MRLHEYVANVLAGARQGWAADEAKAGDSLVKAFERLEAQRKEVESLRPTSVYDEGAKTKLEGLLTKIEHNQAVLSKLETVCSQLEVVSLGSLKQRTMELREEARRLEINHEMDLEPFLTAERALGLNTRMYLQNPRVIKMTEERDVKRASNQKEVASINEKIDCIEAVLRDFTW